MQAVNARQLKIGVSLFQRGEVSLGRAARIAGVSTADMISHLSRLGVAVVQGDREAAGTDMETLDEFCKRIGARAAERGLTEETLAQILDDENGEANRR
ncbi:MAG: UPF0175 family protein [Acidobacteria bacterium]|nr:UPF0175 family protein [Acidobacteriota bacterium]